MSPKKLSFEPYNALKSILEVTSSRVGTEFLQAVCYELEKLFEADLVFISEIIDHPITKVAIRYSSSSEYSGKYEVKNTPCDLVFKNGITNINEKVNKIFSAEKDTDFESFFGIPLYNEEKECTGHIAILSNYPRILPNEAEDIALIFARRIDAEMTRLKLEDDNKKITRQLKKLAVTDSLTNIYNRRYFDKYSEETLNRVQRLDCNATLSFIDIDDFKQLNDTYGHVLGDKVLQYLSTILLKNARKGIEHIFRIGGEEFAVISINTSIKNSITYLNRINKELENNPFSPEISITLSIGVDSFKPEDKNSDDAYKRADNKMYEAKTSGKNCIIK